MSARQPDQSEHSAQPAHAALGDTASGSQPQARSRARHAAGPATIDLNQIARFLPRTGIGTDVHAFAAPDSGTPMHLACLEWPGEVGLAGHSDGDVVAHACCDALFSAAGLGDLGSNFGTAEPRWKGASGTTLLSEAARRVREAGFEIGNIAVQLVGERPRVAARSARGLPGTVRGRLRPGILHRHHHRPPGLPGPHRGPARRGHRPGLPGARRREPGLTRH